jgi:hypothetical protein
MATVKTIVMLTQRRFSAGPDRPPPRTCCAGRAQAVWSADAELSCKQRFETAIAEVERALTTEGGVYLVIFAWDQADLTPVTQAVLDQVAADYARARPTRVALAGHADRSGTEAYNEGLSEQRARNVARAGGAGRAGEHAGRAVVRRDPAADSDRGRRARATEPPRGDRVRRRPVGLAAFALVRHAARRALADGSGTGSPAA